MKKIGRVKGNERNEMERRGSERNERNEKDQAGMKKK
jgi:hypothetical protein